MVSAEGIRHALRDSSGNLLAYVWAEGFFVNVYLVSVGYAMAAPSPPNLHHAESFLSHELEARRKRRSLEVVAHLIERQASVVWYDRCGRMSSARSITDVALVWRARVH
jgi:hypothetical protein